MDFVVMSAVPFLVGIMVRFVEVAASHIAARLGEIVAILLC